LGCRPGIELRLARDFMERLLFKATNILSGEIGAPEFKASPTGTS
jgi:hypothetical protein